MGYSQQNGFIVIFIIIINLILKDIVQLAKLSIKIIIWSLNISLGFWHVHDTQQYKHIVLGGLKQPFFSSTNEKISKILPVARFQFSKVNLIGIYLF